MKKLLIIPMLLMALNGLAEDANRIISPFRVISDSTNTRLTLNEAKFKFEITNDEFKNAPFPVLLRTSVNGVWKEFKVDHSGNFDVMVEPGTYKFQFYAKDLFQEIYSQEVEIFGQHEVRVRLDFIRNYNRPYGISVDKPVIYFHSAKDRQFELTVKPEGEFTFVYPEMNQSWKGLARSTGEIAINGIDYPYLFWESNQQYRFHSEGNGFKIEKAEVITFLEKKLTELGLNQQEKTDFITYWGPKLAANETSFVQFSVDDNCNQFATMKCTPIPDFTRRVYIQVTKWDAQFEPYLNDITFEKMKKSDWYIIEWGGFEFESKQNNLTNNGK